MYPPTPGPWFLLPNMPRASPNDHPIHPSSICLLLRKVESARASGLIFWYPLFVPCLSVTGCDKNIFAKQNPNKRTLVSFRICTMQPNRTAIFLLTDGG